MDSKHNKYIDDKEGRVKLGYVKGFRGNKTSQPTQQNEKAPGFKPVEVKQTPFGIARPVIKIRIIGGNKKYREDKSSSGKKTKPSLPSPQKKKRAKVEPKQNDTKKIEEVQDPDEAQIEQEVHEEIANPPKKSFSKIKGLYYSVETSSCDGDDCPNKNRYVNGHFAVRKNGDKINLCMDCVKKIPSLMFWINTAYSKMTKKYFLKAKFLRRNGNFNHYKIDKSSEILKLLHELKGRDYIVPLFGTDMDQIAVRENTIRSQLSVDSYFDLKVQFNFWRNHNDLRKGFDLIPL